MWWSPRPRQPIPGLKYVCTTKGIIKSLVLMISVSKEGEIGLMASGFQTLLKIEYIWSRGSSEILHFLVCFRHPNFPLSEHLTKHPKTSIYEPDRLLRGSATSPRLSSGFGPGSPRPSGLNLPYRSRLRSTTSKRHPRQWPAEETYGIYLM